MVLEAPASSMACSTSLSTETPATLISTDEATFPTRSCTSSLDRCSIAAMTKSLPRNDVTPILDALPVSGVSPLGASPAAFFASPSGPEPLPAALWKWLQRVWNVRASPGSAVPSLVKVPMIHWGLPVTRPSVRHVIAAPFATMKIATSSTMALNRAVMKLLDRRRPRRRHNQRTATDDRAATASPTGTMGSTGSSGAIGSAAPCSLAPDAHGE